MATEFSFEALEAPLPPTPAAPHADGAVLDPVVGLLARPVA
jgi:hypothetical protein